MNQPIERFREIGADPRVIAAWDALMTWCATPEAAPLMACGAEADFAGVDPDLKATHEALCAEHDRVWAQVRAEVNARKAAR